MAEYHFMFMSKYPPVLTRSDVATLRNPQGDIEVEWTYGPNGLNAGQSVQLGEWALHEVGYPALSKTGFVYNIQILDAGGNLLLDNSQVGR